MENKRKESYNTKKIHDELLRRLMKHIDNMPEFETTPICLTDNVNEKMFGVIGDNGNNESMLRFRIYLEDLKK